MKRLFAVAMVPLLMLSVVAVISAQGRGPVGPAPVEREAERPAQDDAEKADDAEEGEEQKQAKVGEAAPDFTLKNANGDEVKLSDFKGKIVVIEWINLDCPWVVPHYRDGAEGAHVKFQRQVREDGGVWLTICSSKPGSQGHFAGDTLKERLEGAGLDPASYLIDEPGTVGRLYQARVTPEMYVICTEGKLQYKGALDNLPAQRRQQAEPVNYVKQAIEALKAGEEIETPERRAYG
jgi:hypothetical protein